jgi:hypothetical protein
MKIIMSFLLCLSLIADSSAADSWVLREDGIGPAKIGMSLAQLNAVLHEKFSTPTGEWESKECFYVKPSRHPDIAFMIEDGRVTRIDVDGAGISTSTGVQVGDPESHAVKVYGSKLKVKPAHYTDGHYLTTRSSDGRYGVRFETDKGKIQSFYAGRYESIQYVEGCL